MSVNKLEIIKEIARKMSSHHPTHDFSHTLRVLNIAKRIAQQIENVNKELLEVAVLLHDIAREEEDESGGIIDHAELGASKAAKILTDLDYSQSFIEQVQHCIKSHRFRAADPNNFPQTIEAKILYDSDKLDAIGAVGVARSFMYAGENGYSLYLEPDPNYNGLTRQKNPKKHAANIEFLAKLSKIKNKLLTEEGRRIAKERHEFMTSFFERLKQEIIGQK